MQNCGKLLLLPNVMSEESSHELYLPQIVANSIQSIDGLIAESEKGGRYFLRRFFPTTFREIPTFLLNEHSQEKDYKELLKQIKGKCYGLISDCGLPCLADPGAKLVALARTQGMDIQAFPGPSSIFLALMLSGFSAQSFAFHGYLDRDPISQIKKFHSQKTTHIFIETPYRNEKLLKTLLENLSDTTHLCIACDLTLPTEQVLTHTIAEWKKLPPPSIHKKPAVFLLKNDK